MVIFVIFRINTSYKSMKKEDLKDGSIVRNIKYGNEEEILHTGIMKTDTGEWIDCVIYKGKDRFGGGEQIFVKRTEDFIKEFELFKSPFDLWMKRVYELLECNMSEDDKKKYVCFGYTEEFINNHLKYFFKCFEHGMSPYKALTLYED